MIEEVVKPTGEVSGVCWSLMGAIVLGAGIVLKFLRDELKEAKADLKAERMAKDKDRKDFEAQTNVMLQNVYRKKGGNSSDS